MDFVEKLLSEDKAIALAGAKEILAQRKETIQALMRIASDKVLKKTNRPAVAGTIELLGELRAAEAVEPLAGLLLFGRKGDIRDAAEERKKPLPPDKRAPAVRALIEIGTPSLRPVTDVLKSISEETENKNSLQLHCLWVIRSILGPELGKAYIRELCEKDKTAGKSQFVRRGLDSMDVFIKVYGEGGRALLMPWLRPANSGSPGGPEARAETERTHILTALRSRDMPLHLRKRAATKAGNKGVCEALPDLRKIALDTEEDPFLRWKAIRALSKLGTRKDLEILKDFHKKLGTRGSPEHAQEGASLLYAATTQAVAFLEKRLGEEAPGSNRQ